MTSKTMLSKLLNQQGQALIETSLASLFLLTVVAVFLMVCYLTFSSYWVKHNLYESLICYQSTHKLSTCEDQAQNKIQKVISLNSEDRVHILNRARKSLSRLEMHLHLPLISAETQKVLFEQSLGI